MDCVKSSLLLDEWDTSVWPEKGRWLDFISACEKFIAWEVKVTFVAFTFGFYGFPFAEPAQKLLTWGSVKVPSVTDHQKKLNSPVKTGILFDWLAGNDSARKDERTFSSTFHPANWLFPRGKVWPVCCMESGNFPFLLTSLIEVWQRQNKSTGRLSVTSQRRLQCSVEARLHSEKGFPCSSLQIGSNYGCFFFFF